MASNTSLVDMERSHLVLNALDTLSGFNSQLAVQVNNTRADIRAAKDRLREEARRSVQAQQSLVEWSKQVESERQLLFEAMAYINDDVHAQHPNLEKLQGDIRRLKDYIAYKVDHAADERDQYRASGVPRALDQELLLDAPAGRGDNALALALSDEFKGEHGGGAGHGPRNEATSIRYEALQLEVGDLRERLDRSEAESAVLIGRIVAEKEALTGDRELLLEQLNQARADHGAAEETIANLRAALADANITAKCAMNDLLVNREHFTERERGLQDDCHRERDRTIALTEQLHAAHRDRDALQRDVAALRELVAERDAALVEERAGREKDRAALTAAMNGIDELTAQVEALRERDVEREIALERILVLEDEVRALGEENGDLRQEVDRLTSEAEEAATRADERDGQLTEANEDRERLSGQLEECLALAEAAASLRDQLTAAEAAAEATEQATAVRMASAQKEIDRLAGDLLAAVEAVQTLQRDGAVVAEELGRYRAKERQLDEWSGAESPLSELMRALQDNRRLAAELADARAQVTALEVFNSQNGGDAKRVGEAIEASRATLTKAAAQLEAVKGQLARVTAQRDESEQRLRATEAQLQAARGALAAAMADGETGAALRANRQQQHAAAPRPPAAGAGAGAGAALDAGSDPVELVALLQAELDRERRAREALEAAAAVPMHAQQPQPTPSAASPTYAAPPSLRAAVPLPTPPGPAAAAPRATMGTSSAGGVSAPVIMGRRAAHAAPMPNPYLNYALPAAAPVLPPPAELAISASGGSRPRPGSRGAAGAAVAAGVSMARSGVLPAAREGLPHGTAPAMQQPVLTHPQHYAMPSPAPPTAYHQQHYHQQPPPQEQREALPPAATVRRSVGVGPHPPATAPSSSSSSSATSSLLYPDPAHLRRVPPAVAGSAGTAVDDARDIHDTSGGYEYEAVEEDEDDEEDVEVEDFAAGDGDPGGGYGGDGLQPEYLTTYQEGLPQYPGSGAGETYADDDAADGGGDVFLTQDRVYVNPQYFSPKRPAGEAAAAAAGAGTAPAGLSPESKYPWLKKT